MKAYLSPVHVNSFGNDATGRFWGLGAPLYRIEAPEPLQGEGFPAWPVQFFRAVGDVEAVKAKARAIFGAKLRICFR